MNYIAKFNAYMFENNLTQKDMGKLITDNNSLVLKERLRDINADPLLVDLVNKFSEFSFLLSNLSEDLSVFFGKVMTYENNNVGTFMMDLNNFNINTSLKTSKYLIPKLGHYHSLTEEDYLLKLKGCIIYNCFKEMEKSLSVDLTKNTLYSKETITEEMILSKADVVKVVDDIIYLDSGVEIEWIKL